MRRSSRISIATFAMFAAVPLLAQPLFAQQGGEAAPPGQPASVQVPTTSAPAQPGNAAQPAGAASQDPTASAPAANAADLKPVKTELVSKLDSKSAKEGDAVVVKTRESVQTADGTQIPKGSKLMGHVTKVQPHSSTSQNSELAVSFDQAQLKGGQTVLVRAVIESVSAPEGSGGQSSDAMAPVGPTAGGAAGGGAMAGGARGSAGGAASAPSASAGPATSTTAAPEQSSSGQAPSSAAGRVVAGSGATAIRTTDIPNVYLASNAALKDSGVLFAAKDNVHLDGGTQMVVDIAPQQAQGSH